MLSLLDIELYQFPVEGLPFLKHLERKVLLASHIDIHKSKTD